MSAVDTDRLVPTPVFLLSPVRSGSTLLRCILDSHPAVAAPHELHLTKLDVSALDSQALQALEGLGLDPTQAKHLLWDRLLHRILQQSAKSVVVEKSPTNVPAWRELLACWPEARFLYLVRDPRQVLASTLEAKIFRDDEEAAEVVATLFAHLLDAREHHPGVLVRYEDLAADPAGVVTSVCEWLGVPYVPAMLDYGRFDHGPLERGIGDWGTAIRSGQVGDATTRPLHAPPPDRIDALAGRLGYS